ETDAVAGFEALRQQVTRHLIGAIVHVAERVDRVVRDHRVARAVARGVQLIAALLEQVGEALAFLPPVRVVRIFADQHFALASPLPVRSLVADAEASLPRRVADSTVIAGPLPPCHGLDTGPPRAVWAI